MSLLTDGQLAKPDKAIGGAAPCQRSAVWRKRNRVHRVVRLARSIRETADFISCGYIEDYDLWRLSKESDIATVR